MKKVNESPADVDAAIRAVDDLSGALACKLESLSRITELAAFACEARRTLDGVYDSIENFPEVEAGVLGGLYAPRNWMEFKDATGEVLRTVSQQIDQCNDDLSGCVLRVHKLRSANRSAKT